jgi:hypothetical protein
MRHYMLRERMGLLLVTAVFLFLIAGCGPKNAEEFRKSMHSGAPLFTTVESFEVARPFKDVTATLRQKSKECLDVTISVICTNCIANREMGKRIWKPTFIATPERTELHLQLKRTDLITIGDPPDGLYEIVLDAAPLDKNRTKIDIYRMNPNKKFIHNAMRGWVKGDTMGCPDLTTTQ